MTGQCARCEQLEAAARELLEAEEAYRRAGTLQATARLARARRIVSELLERQPTR